VRFFETGQAGVRQAFARRGGVLQSAFRRTVEAPPGALWEVEDRALPLRGLGEARGVVHAIPVYAI